jgi:predicted SAM-dependent methyltransferase
MLVKRLAKTVLPVRTQQYLKTVIGRRRARQLVDQMRAAGQDIRIEIGSGPVRGRNGLISVDLHTDSDIPWDLRFPLPFPDNSISLIYSSHLMEHFHYPDLIELLKHCLRVLRPGGIYSACVPDASIYVRSYLQSTPLKPEYLAHRPAVISDKKMDVINYIAYMGDQHRYMFDEENLVQVLGAAGFANVRIREFDASIDLAERRNGSIYVCGVKP